MRISILAPKLENMKNSLKQEKSLICITHQQGIIFKKFKHEEKFVIMIKSLVLANQL